QATSEAGVRIPDEIALASYDDTPWFEVMTPPITAIAQPVSELGRVSLDLLTGLMRGEEVKSVQLPSTFVPRRSCGELI
ncbi:MAG: substrate-binding domain-containing protein, partial [Mycetocola sp.]